MPKENSKNRLNVVAIRLDDAMLNELKTLAEREDRPLANLCVRLIREALEARKDASQP
jgi:predicted transcriptional regulator